MNTDNVSKFPFVLRHGFVENNLTFPNDTEWHYNRVSAYRVVFREQDDNKPVDRNDFRSYAELNKPMRGKNNCFEMVYIGGFLIIYNRRYFL